VKTRHSILWFVLLCFTPLLALGQILDGTSNTIQIQPTRGLPDLVPVDMSVDRDCRIVVIIRNNGPAIVPDAGYSLSPPGSSGVQMYSDGAPWGGIVLGGFDPAKSSQPVGGTATYTWFSSLALPPGSHVVKVDVDNNNSIAENNEANNSLTEKLACVPQRPDLQPTDITLDPQCRVLVTLRNNGPSPVPDSEYAHDAANAGVQLYKDGAGWGGVILGGADPAKATQPAGGTVVSTWWTAAANLTLTPGTYVMKVDVDNANHLAEANEANNSLTKTVTCLPDLQPVDITLDPQCRILLTLRNNGPSDVPDSEYAHVAGNAGIQMYKDGAGWGGVILGGADPTKATKPAGGTVVSTWWTGAANLALPFGTHVLKVDVDNNNHLTEANEGNNSLTKTLVCQSRFVAQPPTTTKP
jgi:hypothetical protein